jgi:hypothetical protein
VGSWIPTLVKETSKQNIFPFHLVQCCAHHSDDTTLEAFFFIKLAIHIYIYICKTALAIYIYIYREREREPKKIMLIKNEKS